MKTVKFLSSLLAFALALSLAIPAAAADSDVSGETLTRGELVSELFILSGGADAEAASSDFEDVPAGGELAKAVRWAADSKIVYGYGDGRFGPDDPVTREQMAAMLYRNAQALGQGFQGAWMFLLDYPDAAEISDWADEAMHWVVMNGIILGTDRGLEPKALTTKDQLSVILDRWQTTLYNAETAGWTREGYYADENGNILSVTWMEDVEEPDWYVGCMLGEDLIEDAWGGMLPEEGNALHGALPSSGGKEPLIVTVTEEGEAGLLFVVEGGDTFHFLPMDLPEATIFIHINVEGWGNIDYAEGETAPEIDPEYPFQSAQINLAEPATYTFAAWPNPGNLFVKWTKNGEDFSTESEITVLLDESADFVAVFEEDPDWQNPVMNFIGEYQCERAHAVVECFGDDSALITIEWGDSAWSLARWSLIGPLDTEKLTVKYSNCLKTYVTYDDSGELVSEEVLAEDCSGTIVFDYDDLSFTWHDDQSEYGVDMVFEFLPTEG